MMKKQLSIILLLACTSVALGQGHLTVTPLVGARYASLVGSDVSDYFNGRLGYSFGVEAEWQASPLFGISLGAAVSKNVVAVTKSSYNLFLVDMARLYIFSVTGKKGIDIGSNTVWGSGQVDVSRTDAYIKRDNYRFCTTSLELPILANFHIWKGLTVKTGIQLNVALSNKMKYDYEFVVRHPSFIEQSDCLLSPGTEDGRSEDIGDYLSGVSLSVPVGVSYEYKNIVLDVRYAFGLTAYGDEASVKPQRKVDDDLRSKAIWYQELDGAANSRQNMLTITLGYRFKL